jgi:hypothetical protein
MYINTRIRLDVLCGCETGYLTLREEDRLRVFGNRAMRKIFKRKRDEVTADWRLLHNEAFHDSYISPNIIRVVKLRRTRRAWRMCHVCGRRREMQGSDGETEGK